MAKSEKGSEKDTKEKDETTAEATPKEKRRRDILYGKGEYRILGKKGEGTFSEVLKCQNIKDGSYWACKKMKQTYDSLDQVNNLREIQAMRRLANHANILELEEVIFDKKSGTLVLICELMDMNIYELIRGKRHYLPERKVKNYMYQLCKSVEHMHRNGIFHRDVKPENILIKEDLLKLADFGSCRSIYSKQPYTEYISTRWYRAPECLLTDGYYTYKMDMWSVGCVFFEILSLHPLFPGSNEVDQIAKIHDIMGTPEPNVLNKFKNLHPLFPGSNEVDQIAKIHDIMGTPEPNVLNMFKKSRGMNFNFPTKKGSGIERLLPHASTESIDLIYKLCTYDPDERMTAKQALRHSYFKELRDTEKRQIALNKAKILQEKDDNSNVGTKSEPEPSVSPKLEKKKDSEIHLIASLPKPQSLPAHQLFKDKRKVYQRRRRLGEPNNTTYNSTHSNFFPKVPLHASTINPSYHSSSFPSTFATHSTSNQLSLLPSINSTYKSHKNPSTKTKNMFGHYQLPSLDRRGAGF